ncbi:MAG: DNA translocase FtsK, partial [Tidjanibacter sp.]|nr:DNA translocase FtsK [Tidjanibacter sp.]
IGIEIPNRTRETVSFFSVVKSLKFQDSKYELPIVLGKTIQNETFVIDLAKMPHLLVAGATGQGKSVGLNVIISSLLYKKHPAELKFVMVDPKKVELSLYSKLERHFLAKMESEEDAILTDTQKVVNTLNSLCKEMEARYELLRRAQVRKISEYNDKFLQRRLPPDKLNPNGLLSHRYLPYIVVVVDEFADMIMTAGKEVEAPITRLAQLARAVGIHLIIATQRPDVKVITGLIKANFPARIAFRVTSMVDSRTIIDQPGANQLIGQGDMLMLINGELTRLQCAFLDTPEIERITEFISRQKGYPTAYPLPDYAPEGGASVGGSEPMGEISYDPMFREIANFVVQHQQGSTSYIQRRFTIGYTRAARIMDQLESAGIVGPVDGGKPREVLVYDMGELARILEGLGL